MIPHRVTLMLPTPLKTFLHPAGVYRLEYPAHWDQAQEDDGRACGFGPHDRDDVGLWISILPMSLDTDRLTEELPRLMGEALHQAEASDLRRDPTLDHYALKADMRKEGQGGHYWIVAAGDVVLFASSQVPVAERDVWNPAFERLMASLQVTRDEELLLRKVANEVMERLRARYPEQNFEYDGKGIRGRDRVVFLSNLYREVQAAPSRRTETIAQFVENLGQTADASMGHETWEEVRDHVLPVLKPRDYIVAGTATQHLLTSEWLADVVICYVIRRQKLFRFVTGWDVGRWGTDAESFHKLAVDNLSRLPWPGRLEGSRHKDGGRVILVETGDGLASSRLLHPGLHHLLAGALGSPFWAGVPDRDTLVVYSDRRALKRRIARRLRKDHDTSAYPITPRPFLVTPDGVAPAAEA
ncbi:MAG TPA: DUF1444 family protein [Gemmataceae bacterium]|nr:DUF1444 family protein [Gemmataceae bacterium]